MIERMSTVQLHSTALTSIAEAQAAVTRLQTQLGTGKRLLAPSDDASASTELLRLKSALTRTETLQKNLDVAETNITIEETALTSAINVLQRVRELMLLGNTDTLGVDERYAVTAELGQLKEQLLTIANTQSASGDFVFAGTAVDRPAFSSDGIFLGNDNRLSINVAKGVTMPIRSVGSALFGNAALGSDVFGVINDFSNGMLQSNANASDGAGLSIALDKIDVFMDNISSARSEAGTKLNRIDDQRAIHESTSLHVTNVISKLEDVDFAKAVTELNLHMTALQAAQQTFVKTQNMTIFNYM